MEIEKKYLVNSLPDNLETYPHSRMAQSYISRNPVIRLRQIGSEAGNRYVLTVKGEGLTVREEFELDISEESYLQLLKKAEGIVIEKTRYYIPLPGGHMAELDVFEGKLEGLKLVEVEFESEAMMQQFIAPVWFGEDVSENGAYHNSNLSQMGGYYGGKE